jgi:hypothetical protein
MLTKTIVAGGMLIATATGAIITAVPASATPAWGGGCCSSSRSHFFQAHRNRNWNGNENEGFNHIRLRIRNRNNNIAVARTEEERRRRGGGEALGAPIVGAPGA